MRDDTKLFLCCIGMIGGGVLAGWGLRGIKDRKEFEDLNASVATVLSLCKDGYQFDQSAMEFLKKHGFNDRYMFR